MVTKVTFQIEGDASKGIAAVDQLHRKLAALTNSIGLRNLHAAFAQASTAATQLNHAMNAMARNMAKFNQLNTLAQQVTNNFRNATTQARHLASQVGLVQVAVTRLNNALASTARAAALAFRQGAFSARSGGFSGAQVMQSLGIGFRMSGLAVGSSLSAFGMGGSGPLGTLLALPKLASGLLTTATELGVRVGTALAGGIIKVGGTIASGLVNTITTALGSGLSIVGPLVLRSLGDAVKFIGQGVGALLTGVTNLVGEAVLQMGNIFTGLAEIVQRTFATISDIVGRVLGGVLSTVEKIAGRIGSLVGGVGKGVFGAGALVGGLAFRDRASTELGLARAEVLLEERLTPDQRIGLQQWVRSMNREIAPLMERSEIASTLERVVSTGFQGSLEEAKKVAENSLKLATALGEKESSAAARVIAKAVGLFRDEFEKQGQDPFTEITNSIFNLVNYGDLRLPEIVDRLGEILASGKAVNATFLETMTLLAQMSQSLGVEQTFTDVRHLLVDPLKFSDDALGMLKSKGVDTDLIGQNPIQLIERMKQVKFSAKELSEIFPNKRALVGFLVQMFQDPDLGRAIAEGMKNNRGLDTAGQVVKNTLAARMSRLWQGLKAPFDITFDVTDSPIKKFFDSLEHQLERFSGWWKKMIEAPEAGQFFDTLSAKVKNVFGGLGIEGDGLSASSFWGGLTKGLETVWQVGSDVAGVFKSIYEWLSKIADASGVFGAIGSAMSGVGGWLKDTASQGHAGSSQNITDLFSGLGSIFVAFGQDIAENFQKAIEVGGRFLKTEVFDPVISSLVEIFGPTVGVLQDIASVLGSVASALSDSGFSIGKFLSNPFYNPFSGGGGGSPGARFHTLGGGGGGGPVPYMAPEETRAIASAIGVPVAGSPAASSGPLATGRMGTDAEISKLIAAKQAEATASDVAAFGMHNLKRAIDALTASVSSAAARGNVVAPPPLAPIKPMFESSAAASAALSGPGPMIDWTAPPRPFFMTQALPPPPPMFPSAAAAQSVIQPFSPLMGDPRTLPGLFPEHKMVRGVEMTKGRGDLSWKPSADERAAVSVRSAKRMTGAPQLGMPLGADFEGVGGSIFGFGLAPSSLRKKLQRAQRDPDFEGGRWNRYLKNAGRESEGGGGLKDSADKMAEGSDKMKEGVDALKGATEQVAQGTTSAGKDFTDGANSMVSAVNEMKTTISGALTTLKDELVRLRNDMNQLKSKVGSGSSGASGGS